jgi:uncharacterized protein YjbI with pentapeptide repeats
MATPEHSERLREGVFAWDEWRDSNPDLVPNLHEADLSGADLNRANLKGADLSGANLRDADLWGADLSEASLEGANLSEANLREAQLWGANLNRANLNRANLSVANLNIARLWWANLSEANLGGANLTAAYLSEADLKGANLSEANLSEANLGRTNLSEASLNRANLYGANLREANLTGANLAGANLRKADLSRARLDGTRFAATRVHFTQWCDVDLSGAVDLESIRHLGPSTVGIDTLAKSKGRIPQAFLRGCGLADWEVVARKLHDPSLRDDEQTDVVYEILRLKQGQPIMFHSVFISYSTSDEEFATKLHGDLQGAGVRCWFAPHDIASGKKIHEQIDRAIHVQDRLLLILSTASMSSEWVKTELANARAKEREQKRQVLFPLRLVSFDEVRNWKAFDADIGGDSAREVREYYIPDFSNWKDEKSYKPAFERLLKDLRARDDRQRE